MMMMRAVVLLSTLATVVALVFWGQYSQEAMTWAEYAAARDIMMMLVVGFGFLMSFLKLYGLGAVGYTYLLTALVVVCSIPVEGFFERVRSGEWSMLDVGVPQVVSGEFAAAAVLISFGAVLGKASVDQLAVVAVVEVFCYAAHKQLVLLGALRVEDVGGSLSIHLWGAYFGLGCAYALGVPTDRGAAAEGADVKSDVLALLGTTVLFVFWPSFVGAEVTGDPGMSTRCTVNTVLALCGSALAAFLCSGLASGHGLRAVDVQNASLAGGVGIGAAARLKAVTPGGALVVGLLSGGISTWGYAALQPRLLSACGLHDTCGVHNLHGLPAIFSGFASALFVAVAPKDQVYEHGAATALERAGYQLLGTVLTFVAATLAGVVAGKVADAVAPRSENYVTFHDVVGWDVGEDYNRAWDAALDGSKHNNTLDGSRKGLDGSKNGKKANLELATPTNRAV